MNAEEHAVTIVDDRQDAGGRTFTLDWRLGEGDAIRLRLASDGDGVALHFGPAVAVAGWPTWLRAVAMFGPDGGRATLWLDPLRADECGSGSVSALGLQGCGARGGMAALASRTADTLRERYPTPSPDERQAIETCAGLALTFSDERADERGIAPTPAPFPDLFRPSPLPILIDDANADPVRQHVRLTYRLPRLDGRWTDGCSLRLFKDERVFGIEFRALSGDHLPAPLRPACVEDDLGPLLRFSIDRSGRGTTFDGTEEYESALRLVRAIARQVSNDLIAHNAPIPIAGFEAPHWRHWLAALPDLLATPPAKPLGATK